MKTLISFLFIFTSAVFLSGCFDFLNPSNKSYSTSNKASTITAAQFSGIASAANKISGIMLTWPAVTDSSLVKAYRIYRVSGNTRTLIASLAPSLTSYMDGTVETGAIYTYSVQAVDQNDLEDGNTKIAKSLNWIGISSIIADSRSSIQVNFPVTTAVADEIRVYAQLSMGSPKILLAIVTGSDQTAELNGLRTGYPYIISAQAYVASLGKEDGNDLTYTVSTLTQGFDSDGASSPQWANVMAVRAFGEAPAAPAHPVTPAKSPNTRVVELAFNAFSSTGTSAKYVVTRAIDGFTMDSSVTTACSETTFTSCRVCDGLSASNGVINCTDSTVAASPARYRYALSLIQTDADSGDSWPEPLPSNQDVLAQFSILVPIPPKNMILVQRDAANYEMCNQLNKPSDPLNHNRCLYSGVGGSPYSTGHNKPPLNMPVGYYDFGYNLFVDRWEMACNWTMASQGAMCGTNHTSGDCIGFGTSTGSPQASQGKVGDVYMYLGPGANACYMAVAADGTGAITWASVPTIHNYYSNAADLYQKMLTSDPGYITTSGSYDLSIPGRKMKFNYNSNVTIAAGICSSQTDPNYGVKRISRTREYIVYSAPAILTGEPYTYNSYTNFNSKAFVANTYHNSSYTYGCENGNNKDTPPSSLVQLLDSANYPAFKEMSLINGPDANGVTNSYGVNSGTQFIIGAMATIDCQSRYGVQDMMRSKYTSDVMFYDNTTLKVTGVISPYDNGNRDLLSDLNGGTTGYSINVSNFTQNTGGQNGALPYNSALITAFVPTLGLPIMTSSYSSDYLPQAQITQPYGLSFYVPLITASSGLVGSRVTGRWTIQHHLSPNQNGSAEVRCVLPAE